MADKIKAIKIKQKNGTYSEEVPISVNVQNVQWDENNHTLLDALGSVDISSSGKGNLQHQIDELDGDKISTNEFNSRLNDFLKDQISADTTDWLDDNVNPVGSAVIVDKTLTIEGAAADALAVKTELNKKANASNTYTKAEVNAAIDAKQIEVDDTLSITGTAADAKAVGDELTAVKADLDAIVPGLSDDAKAALITCFNHVMWDGDGTGQTYIDTLKAEIGVVDNPFEDAVYELGAYGYNYKDNPSSGCVNKNDTLTTRVRTAVPVSCRHGRITAKTGYEINMYMLNSRSYGEWSTTGGVTVTGYNDMAYVEATHYKMGTEKEILTGTKYVLVVVRKTSNEAFTQQEAENIYGTGFVYEEA